MALTETAAAPVSGPFARPQAVVGRLVRFPLHLLQPGQAIRIGGLRADHLEAVMQLGGNWPPLLVTEGGRIVDGNYRYAAAKKLGHRYVDAHVFEGDDVDSFVEAVRCNAQQGLPLTLEERRTAARRVLVGHTEWSDRRIGVLCGLAHETVGRLRRDLREGGEIRHLDRRIGRDGKSQPVGGAPGPRLGAEATRPTGVRCREADVEPPSADPAFTSTDEGRDFVAWFEHTAIDDGWIEHVRSVPLSRVYLIADEARRRAAAWSAFADAVAGRVVRHAPV